MQDFRRLVVWQRAHTFVLDVRRATDAFPRAGYGELKAQLRRAAESIASNVVEGCAAASRKDFARYLDISIKSASEVDYQLQLARDLGVLGHDAWKPLAREVVELRRMLSGLRRPRRPRRPRRTRRTRANDLTMRVLRPDDSD